MVLLQKRPFELFLVTHPDYVQEVLVTQSSSFRLGPVRGSMKRALGEGLLTAEGDLHNRQRRLIQSGLHRRHIERFGETMASHTLRHIAAWQDGQVVDASQEMRELTLRIVVEALCSSEVRESVPRIGDATDAMNQYLSKRGRNPLGPCSTGYGCPPHAASTEQRRLWTESSTTS